MKFGRFEIDDTVIIWSLLAIIIAVTIMGSVKVDIEKEKTKQMMYEKSLVVIPEKTQKSSCIKRI